MLDFCSQHMHGERDHITISAIYYTKKNVPLSELLISDGLKCPEINPRKTNYIIPNNKKLLPSITNS